MKKNKKLPVVYAKGMRSLTWLILMSTVFLASMIQNEFDHPFFAIAYLAFAVYFMYLFQQANQDI